MTLRDSFIRDGMTTLLCLAMTSNANCFRVYMQTMRLLAPNIAVGCKRQFLAQTLKVSFIGDCISVFEIIDLDSISSMLQCISSDIKFFKLEYNERVKFS